MPRSPSPRTLLPSVTTTASTFEHHNVNYDDKEHQNIWLENDYLCHHHHHHHRKDHHGHLVALPVVHHARHLASVFPAKVHSSWTPEQRLNKLSTTQIFQIQIYLYFLLLKEQTDH